VALNPELIRKFVLPGTVFVLDEVWRLWPSGVNANDVPEAFRSLLAEHGHMVDEKGDAVSITLLVQDLANIGGFARRLVEQTFIHTKLTHVGMSKRFRCDIYHGPQTGQGQPTKRLREVFGTYDEKVYRYYKSHTMSEAGKDGANEKHTDKRGNVLRRPMLIAGVCLVPLLVVFGVWRVVGFFRQGGPVASSVAKEAGFNGAVPAARQVASAQKVVPVNHAQAEEPPRASWRVVGTIESKWHPEKSIAILSDGSRTVSVGFRACRRVSGQPLRCELEGRLYSETGAVFSALVSDPIRAGL
jgi:zona occludens toxin